MTGRCYLCLQTGELKHSHIIPRFVFLWYKKGSIAALRRSDNPNLRVQDGPKDYLLCGSCEQKFSQWETPFSTKVFIPLHRKKSPTRGIQYGPWAVKFAVSVSWRVATYHQKNRSIFGFSLVEETALSRALEAWRLFLLGLSPLPNKFQQHLLPLDVIEKHTLPDISPFINRYLLRSAHADVIGYGKSILVFTKMFRIVIFGFIDVKKPRHWKKTRLREKGGTLGGPWVHYSLPQPIIQFMNNKAHEAMNSQSQLSRKQREKINELFTKTGNAIRDSEVARAMSYDIAHCGSEAFFQGKEKET